MVRKHIFFIALFLSVFSVRALPQETAFLSFSYEGCDTCTLAPVLWGFHPDPSVCTDGKTHYLANSSFSYWPGVPVSKSSDLREWTSAGYALSRESQLQLSGGGVSAGIFAPDVSYNPKDSLFYMVTMNMTTFKVFYVTSKDPEKGWGEPVQLTRGGMDPSFFFDFDGEAYLLFTTRPKDQAYPGEMAIGIVPFDCGSGAVKGEPSTLARGKWIEGPHMYKVGEYYYLMCAEGGTDENHCETLRRSSSPYGPWEKDPSGEFLSQKVLGLGDVTSIGHADIIRDASGNWTAFFLGCRPYGGDFYNTGRETFSIPVHWEDGWLRASAFDRTPKAYRYKYGKVFDGKPLGDGWMYLRNPKEDPTPFFRQMHKNFTVIAEMSKGEKGKGLIFFQNEDYYISYIREGRALTLTSCEGGTVSKASVRVPSGRIFLRVEGKGGKYSFSYRKPSGKWKTAFPLVDATLLSTAKAGGYVGTMIGLKGF